MADKKDFSETVKETLETVDALSVRERVILFASLVAVIVGGWDLLIFSGVSKSHDRIESQINEVRDRIDEQEGSRDILVAQLSVDPNQDIKDQKKQLKDELASMSKDVKKLSKAFVPAEQLPMVLEGVLEKNELVSLVSLEMKPVQALQNKIMEKNDRGENVERVNGVIYQHGFKVVLEGKYFDAMNYLKQLEMLEWQIYWQSMEYSVLTYPTAQIALEVFTLSEKG